MNIKRPSLLLLGWLLLATPAAVHAQFNYTTNNGTITITAYAGGGGDVVIPSMINGLPVTSIGDSAFYYCWSLTNVTIPSSVTNIGEGVFLGCTSLTNITVDPFNSAYSSLNGVLFDEGQTMLIQYPVGNVATSYTIPNSVTSIGDYAFEYCGGLTSLTIPNSVTDIGDYVFEYCGLTNVTIPNSVTSIGDYAFSGCPLTSVTIPNGVTSIRDSFSDCSSLINVIIGSGVTNIGDQAFSQCTSLMAIDVSVDNNSFLSVDGVLFDRSQTTLIQFPVGSGATSYSIPNGVTKIGDDAFRDCPSLTSVTIPNSVINIGDSAFSDCLSLTSVYFQGNAPISGANLFDYRVPIPQSVGYYYLYDPATVYYLPGTTGWSYTFAGLPAHVWQPQIPTSVVFTSLYSFTGGSDGANPVDALVQGSDGNFYGTAGAGGAYTNQYGRGLGTVFKISTNGALTSLYSFGSVQDTNGVSLDGAVPNGLVQGRDGDFYGTTGYGGTNVGPSGGYGTVFKITTHGALTTLYSFTGANDGTWPMAALVQGSDGNFYGTTSGSVSGPDYGTVFKITTNGMLTTLYSFGSVRDTNGVSLDGANPLAAMVQGNDGYFYGTTYSGGTNGAGTVFKITSNGALTTLYSFGSVQDTNGDSLDGTEPWAGLVQGSDGYFYGTTELGGAYRGPDGFGEGTVFKISTNGVLTTWYSFAGNDGESTRTLVQGSDGNFYGTTPGHDVVDPPYGTVFKITTNGVLTTLYSFTGANDGAYPFALVQGSDGSFYGTTYGGGTNNAGTVFRLTIVPQPQLTIIPSGPYVILTWPTNYAGFSCAGFTLQSTTDLGSSAVWSTNSSTPVVIGGENVVINAMSGKQQFYRLSSP
jgi:uncharacterized repeat protein (TIGR03803 family)